MFLQVFYVLVALSGISRTSVKGQNGSLEVVKETELTFEEQLNSVVLKTNDTVETRDEKLLKSWKIALKFASDGIRNGIKSLLPSMIKTASDVDMSPECQGSFLALIGGLKSFKFWAVSMLDATGKIPVGITRATLYSLGDYDLCLSVKVKEKTKQKAKITGKYCSAIFTPMLPKNVELDFVNLTGPDTIFGHNQDKVKFMASMKFRLGLCIPSTCNAEDMNNLFSTVLRGYPLDVEVLGCEVKEEKVFNWQQVFVMFVFTVLGIVLISATAVDLLSAPKNGALSILLHFSLYTNGKRLLKTEVKTNRLLCLNGMKVLCITWIVLTHTFHFIIRYSMNRTLNYVEFAKDPFFSVLLNTFFVVDTFFLISGLLVANMGMMYLETSGGHLNIFGFYARRLWRLFPSIAFIVGVAFLLPLMGSGPLWNEVVTREAEVCQRTWWATLLFINSWFDYFDMCLVYTWFVSVDVLFYAFSPLFLIMFYKKPKLGIIISCVLTFLSCLWSAIIVVAYKLNVWLPLNTEKMLKFKDLTLFNHFFAVSHIGTYLIGFLFGYLLYRKSEIKLNKVMVLLGWALSTTLALGVIMSEYDWLNGSEPTVPGMAAHQSLYRVAWSFSVCWVIFACCYGYGGWVNTLLSWKIFIPFNRLVYMIYLTQMPVMWVRMGSKKHTVPFEHIETIYEFLGNLVITVAVSAMAYLAVEAPFASLDRVIFGGMVRKARRVSKIIRNSLRINDTSNNLQVSNNQNANNDPEKQSQHPENYVYRRKRSEEDVVGKLTASMVTTVSPESEPITDTEEQAKKMAELRLNPELMSTLRAQTQQNQQRHIGLSQILDNFSKADAMTESHKNGHAINYDYNGKQIERSTSPPPLLTQRKRSNEELFTNLNIKPEKPDDTNKIELTNMKNT